MEFTRPAAAAAFASSAGDDGRRSPEPSTHVDNAAAGDAVRARRDALQRELCKQQFRVEIIARELSHQQALEAELRRQLGMGMGAPVPVGHQQLSLSHRDVAPRSHGELLSAPAAREPAYAAADCWYADLPPPTRQLVPHQERAPERRAPVYPHVGRTSPPMADPMPVHRVGQVGRGSFGSSSRATMNPEVERYSDTMMEPMASHEHRSSFDREPFVERTLSSARVPMYPHVEEYSLPITEPVAFHEQVAVRQERRPSGWDQYPKVDGNPAKPVSNKSRYQGRVQPEFKRLQSSLQEMPVGEEKSASYRPMERPVEFKKTVPPERAFHGVNRKLPAFNSSVSSWKWSCAICKVNTISSQALEEHCAGQEHKANAELLESEKKITGLKRKAVSEANAELFKAQKRISGLKRKAQAESLPPINHEPFLKWTCDICPAKCTSQLDLEKHFLGRKHRENFEARGKEFNNTGSGDFLEAKASPQIGEEETKDEAMEAEATPITTGLYVGQREISDANLNIAKKPPANGFSFRSRSQLQECTEAKDGEVRELHICKPCNVRCYSKKVLFRHLAGKRHLAMLNGEPGCSHKHPNFQKKRMLQGKNVEQN